MCLRCRCFCSRIAVAAAVVVSSAEQSPRLRVEDSFELLRVDGPARTRRSLVPVGQLVRYSAVAGHGASDDGGEVAEAVDEAWEEGEEWRRKKGGRKLSFFLSFDFVRSIG